MEDDEIVAKKELVKIALDECEDLNLIDFMYRLLLRHLED
mgnify:CR=1 FL=1